MKKGIPKVNSKVVSTLLLNSKCPTVVSLLEVRVVARMSKVLDRMRKKLTRASTW